MNFQSAVFANLSFLFLGAFFGSLFCILCGKAFKRKYFKFRLSLCFLLLSAAVVFAVLFVMVERQACAQVFSLHVKESFFAVALYSLAGLLCAASLRLLFPIAALLYIAWTLSFGLYLYKKMPLPQKYAITVGESFARDEQSGAEWKFSNAKAGAALDFAVYEMDKNALFPLPHYWHILLGARAADDSPASAPDVFAPGTERLDKFFSAAAKRLLGNPSVRSLELPAQQVYPVIYEVNAGAFGKSFSASAKKIM